MKTLTQTINESFASINEASIELFLSAAEKADKYGQERADKFREYAELLKSKKDKEVRKDIEKELKEISNKLGGDEIKIKGKELEIGTIDNDEDYDIADITGDLKIKTNKLFISLLGTKLDKLQIHGAGFEGFSELDGDKFTYKIPFFEWEEEINAYVNLYFMEDDFYLCAEEYVPYMGGILKSKYKKIDKITFSSRNAKLISDAITLINPNSKYTDPGYLK